MKLRDEKKPSPSYMTYKGINAKAVADENGNWIGELSVKDVHITFTASSSEKIKVFQETVERYLEE